MHDLLIFVCSVICIIVGYYMGYNDKKDKKGG